MDATSREILWGQFGGAIDMLENAMRACPDSLWSDRARKPEFWYLAYHTLFFLDLYLHDTGRVRPAAAVHADELDPSGSRPIASYGKAELLSYLNTADTSRARVSQALNAETAVQSDVATAGTMSPTSRRCCRT